MKSRLSKVLRAPGLMLAAAGLVVGFGCTPAARAQANNGHAVGSDGSAGLMLENAGNERFLTEADLDNDDKP